MIQQEPVPPREVESGDEASKNEEETVKPRSVSFAANVQQVEISPRPSESSEDFVTAPATDNTTTDSINVPEVEVVPPSPVQAELAEPSEE